MRRTLPRGTRLVPVACRKNAPKHDVEFILELLDLLRIELPFLLHDLVGVAGVVDLGTLGVDAQRSKGCHDHVDQVRDHVWNNEVHLGELPVHVVADADLGLGDESDILPDALGRTRCRLLLGGGGGAPRLDTPLLRDHHALPDGVVDGVAEHVFSDEGDQPGVLESPHGPRAHHGEQCLDSARPQLRHDVPDGVRRGAVDCEYARHLQHDVLDDVGPRHVHDVLFQLVLDVGHVGEV
mmetsp:Transcript_87630/g.252725  ORF Transcript_87630/g.252725 Transcript_87630/m.252725 type:complete len:238 (+) Transcript_87630:283-996(+)